MHGPRCVFHIPHAHTPHLRQPVGRNCTHARRLLEQVAGLRLGGCPMGTRAGLVPLATASAEGRSGLTAVGRGAAGYTG